MLVAKAIIRFRGRHIPLRRARLIVGDVGHGRVFRHKIIERHRIAHQSLERGIGDDRGAHRLLKLKSRIAHLLNLAWIAALITRAILLRHSSTVGRRKGRLAINRVPYSSIAA